MDTALQLERKQLRDTITALPKHFHTATSRPRYLERLASVGIPQSGVEVRVVDDGMWTLPAGEMGEIAATTES